MTLISVLGIGVISNVLLTLLRLGRILCFPPDPVVSIGPTTIDYLLSYFFKGGRASSLVTIKKISPDVSVFIYITFVT